MAKASYDDLRKAEFKELARYIVLCDRDARKYKRVHDLAGAIARALENAYQRGWKESLDGEPIIRTLKRPNALEWILIPPRPRTAFWSICLRVYGYIEGKKESEGYGVVYCYNDLNRRTGWTLCELRDGELVYDANHTWGDATIQPLVKRGLLALLPNKDDILQVTETGLDTWWEANELAHKHGHDHVMP